MLIVELVYKKPIAEVDKHLQAHRSFLQSCYDQGLLVASGPKDPRDGGILIALTDKTTMNEVIKQDPFYINGVAEYHITQFEPVKYSDDFAVILKKAEQL